MFVRNIAAAFRVAAGRKSVVENLSNSLVERNHELDHLFSVKEVVMKEKLRKKKGDTEEEENDDEVDAEGYKDINTVGISIAKLSLNFN